jgi:hypothetical protein
MSIQNDYSFINFLALDGSSPLVYPPDDDITSTFNGESGQKNISNSNEGLLELNKCLISDDFNAAGFLETYIIYLRTFELADQYMSEESSIIQDSIDDIIDLKESDAPIDPSLIETYSTGLEQCTSFRDTLKTNYLKIKTIAETLKTNLQSEEYGQRFIDGCVNAQLIQDTPEARNRLQNQFVSDATKFKTYAYSYVERMANISVTLDRTIKRIKDEPYENIVNDFVIDPDVDNGKQNNITTNGSNSLIHKEKYMNVKTSSPEYTAQVEELNKAINLFIKKFPEYVIVTDDDEGKTQITLFYGKTRNVELKKLASRCANTVNDDDYVIGSLPVKIIVADNSVIKFEGKTSEVDAAIKSIGDSSPLVNLIRRSGNHVTFNERTIGNKLSTALEVFILERATYTDTMYREAGIDFATAGLYTRLSVQLDKLVKFIKKWTAIYDTELDEPSENGKDIRPKLSEFEALRDFATEVIRVRSAKVPKVMDKLVEVVERTDVSKFGKIKLEMISDNGLVIGCERAVVYPETDSEDTPVVTPPQDENPTPQLDPYVLVDTNTVVTPVEGTNYYKKVGTKYVLCTNEDFILGDEDSRSWKEGVNYYVHA